MKLNPFTIVKNWYAAFMYYQGYKLAIRALKTCTSEKHLNNIKALAKNALPHVTTSFDAGTVQATLDYEWGTK